MKDRSITIPYVEYESEGELGQEDRELISLAREAATKAYAPYSAFRVGAAVILENGSRITGNNQENAAYPSGLCAERVALFWASSQHPGVPVRTIAIAANASGKNQDQPVPPCGGCLQVMAEFEEVGKNKIRILLAGNNGKAYLFHSVGSLLPFMFTKNDFLL